ncbi:hypothetical protein B0H11DRAFT_2392492 [Mycena galericulata]|nr:hypothetical protein B0H11DRAFT_2392492 [Mycena galericulata]
MAILSRRKTPSSESIAPPDSELVEGCPLVRLNDVAAEVTIFQTYPSKTTILTITGILRLSHKYGVDYVRRCALVHLSSSYFTKLSGFDLNSSDEGPKLAREVDAPWLLPWAFYSLSRCVGADIDLADQVSFLKGCSAQLNAATSAVMRFLHFPVDSPGCSSPAECTPVRLRGLELLRLYREDYIQQADPLLIWRGDDWDSLEMDDICFVCLTRMKILHQQARQEFWEQLPQLYGLPGWTELEKLKSAALRST